MDHNCVGCKMVIQKKVEIMRYKLCAIIYPSSMRYLSGRTIAIVQSKGIDKHPSEYVHASHGGRSHLL
jgi:hypothetical protein